MLFRSEPMTVTHTKPRVLVTGAGGMLGRAVLDAFAGSHETFALRRSDCDLADAAATWAWVESRAPQLIVHCAAWTDVDAARHVAEERRSWD